MEEKRHSYIYNPITTFTENDGFTETQNYTALYFSCLDTNFFFYLIKSFKYHVALNGQSTSTHTFLIDFSTVIESSSAIIQGWMFCRDDDIAAIVWDMSLNFLRFSMN